MHPNLIGNLSQEADAFDGQIQERIDNGHIPDLRMCEPCDWFINNPWRRPAYVKLDFGEQFELIRDAIVQSIDAPIKNIRILEVGCGPGYLSLEMARAGFQVTGLDLSPKCIEVAKQIAGTDPFALQRGDLRYLAADFFTEASLVAGTFDAIVFLGALHHFPNQVQTLNRVVDLLKPGGVVVVHEPVRDRVTRGNVVFVHMLRVLLSLQNGFFKKYLIPIDDEMRELEFAQLFNEMRYETENGENVQSVNDNEAGYAEMRPELDARFESLFFEWRYAFFHEFIGGLRFEDALNVELATYLREIDRELCKLGALSATEFFYVGRKP